MISIDKFNLLHGENNMNDPRIESIQEISYQEIIDEFWKNKWLFSTIVTLSAIVAVIYALIAPELFSTSTLYITKTANPSNSNLSNIAALTGVYLNTGSGNVDPSDYLDKVIQDKEFLQKLLIKKWYYNDDSLFLFQILKIKIKPGEQANSYIILKKQLDYIRGNKVVVNVKDKRTGILTLTVNAPTAQLAFDINNQVLSQLSEYILNSIKSQAKNKREFIEGRISEVKKDLERYENMLATFKEKNMLSSSPKVVLEDMRINRQIALNQELYIQFQKQYEMAKVEELNDQSQIQVIKSPELPVGRIAPNRIQIVFIGLLLGVVFGVLVVLAKRAIYINFKVKPPAL
jgi:uncharacterized protein involved in exopolysaccharide biosynthesis